MNEQLIDINELHQDDHNFNKGTAEGQKLMEKSFKELGAGRSILVDREGNIIAGNKSQKAAIAAGIQKVRVIETDGTELIAVKRTDLDLNSAEGRKLALADNLTTQVNLAWDEVELDTVSAELDDFDASDWGLQYGADCNPDDFGEEFSLPEGDKLPFKQMTFNLGNEQADLIESSIKRAKSLDEFQYVETFGNVNSNGNALYLIVKQWAEQKR